MRVFIQQQLRTDAFFLRPLTGRFTPFLCDRKCPVQASLMGGGPPPRCTFHNLRGHSLEVELHRTLVKVGQQSLAIAHKEVELMQAAAAGPPPKCPLAWSQTSGPASRPGSLGRCLT
jgi:hypothetical protein